MRLRDWPPRRIALMWVMGITLQLLAIRIVPPLLGFEVADPREPWPDVDPSAGAPLDSAAWEARSSDSVTVTREAGPAGDTVIRIAADSSFVVARRRGDTLDVLHASGAMKKGAGQLGTVFAGIMADIVQAVLVMLVLLFAIPFVLLAVTLTWAVQRRRPPA